MAVDISIVEYFNIFVWDQAKEGAGLLSQFADAGINLLAFKSADTEPLGKEFTLFPNDSSVMLNKAKEAGIELDGPYSALLVKSDGDEPGDCAAIFMKLAKANINIVESSGIANINGGYGVILYLNQEECEKAAAVLKS